MKFLDKIKLLSQTDLFKTIYINYKYGFLNKGKMPFRVMKRTCIQNCCGYIEIPKNLRNGSIIIGERCLIDDTKSTPTIWNDEGGVIKFHGRTAFGKGCKINVGKDAILSFGDNFVCTGRSEFYVNKEVILGSDCVLSWDILIMDTDVHPICDQSGSRINNDAPIHIGDNVWINCRTTILKGTIIGSHNVIASGSIITKSFSSNNVIIAGSGQSQRIVKEYITWKR